MGLSSSRNILNSKRNATLWFVLAVVLLSVTYLHMSEGLIIESNILKLLPETENDPVVELAFEKFSERNMKYLLFIVQNKNKKIAIDSAKKFSVALLNNEAIEEIITQISIEQQATIGQFNFNYRYHLLAPTDRQLLLDANYSEFTDTVVQQLFSPFSGGLTALVAQDPFLLSYRFSLANAETSFPGFEHENGVLIRNIDENYYAFIAAKVAGSPFDPVIQQQITSTINSAEDNWKLQHLGNSLYRTGAMFYAEYAYYTARGEISTIGFGSIGLVIGLLVFTFFSVRPIFLVVTALGFGILSGFTLVYLLFGKVHLFTIVFGASLIGVAVDYAFHYLVSNESSGTERLKKILPAITLGLISSIIGYLSLLSTPFPGLQQMAVFCITGLAAAYLTVVLFFPVVKLNIRIPFSLLAVCQAFVTFGQTKSAKFFWKVTLILPIIAILMSLKSSHDNDIRQLQPKNENLTNQEKIIKDILNSPASNQFYLIMAKQPESLLVKLEDTTVKLDKLVEKGVIDGYQSISQWLPSQKKQLENHKLYQALYQSQSLTSLSELGLINTADVSLLQQAQANERDNYLTIEKYLQSPLGDKTSHLWLGKIDERFASVIAIEGINQLNVLSSFDENSIFVDKVSKVSGLFETYRQNAWRLLLIAIALIFCILLLRYNLRKALLMVSSPVIAISVSLIGMIAMGEQINLFNTLALFLVVGIGIDYGLFFAESQKASARTLLAVLLSALTTIFSFGLLALSETSAIHAFGLTMLLGISSVFILSPIIGNLVIKQEESIV